MQDASAEGALSALKHALRHRLFRRSCRYRAFEVHGIPVFDWTTSRQRDRNPAHGRRRTSIPTSFPYGRGGGLGRGLGVGVGLPAGVDVAVAVGVAVGVGVPHGWYSTTSSTHCPVVSPGGLNPSWCVRNLRRTVCPPYCDMFTVTLVQSAVSHRW